MILTIETTKREEFKIGLYQDDVLNWFEFETEDQSADILPALNGVLRNNKLLLKDISAIAVNQGPGSFTGVRVGMAIGNTLAWSLDIPIDGYKDHELEQKLVELKNSTQKKFTNIVLPSYVDKN